MFIVLVGSLAGYGYQAGWDRYLHYRQLPDRGRTTERRVLQELQAEPAAAAGELSGVASPAPPAPATPVVSFGAPPAPGARPSPQAGPRSIYASELAALPDGRVFDAAAPSPVLGRPMGYRIYLPPGYDDPRFADVRYPVVYLLHGAPGGDHDWVDGGAANQTVDALIKSGKMAPFIVVMPDGSLGNPHHDTQWGNSPVTGERVEDALVQNLVPEIDRAYRTIGTREARVIGGLSSGGYGAVNIALHYPDLFTVALSLSGYFMAEKTYDGRDIWGSAAARRLNSPLQQVAHQPLHIAIIADQEGGSTLTESRQFAQMLEAQGIGDLLRVYPGGHTWPFWRDHLLEALLYASDYVTPAVHEHPAPRPVQARF